MTTRRDDERDAEEAAFQARKERRRATAQALEDAYAHRDALAAARGWVPGAPFVVSDGDTEMKEALKAVAAAEAATLGPL